MSPVEVYNHQSETSQLSRVIFFYEYSGTGRRQMEGLTHVWGLEPGSTTKGENEELRVYRDYNNGTLAAWIG